MQSIIHTTRRWDAIILVIEFDGRTHPTVVDARRKVQVPQNLVNKLDTLDEWHLTWIRRKSTTTSLMQKVASHNQGATRPKVETLEDIGDCARKNERIKNRSHWAPVPPSVIPGIPRHGPDPHPQHSDKHAS